MKKIFKTLALMLLTALAFSSCADVPAPFNVPDKSSTSGGSDDSGTNEGIAATCAQAAALAQALADGATSSETYTITGYITEVVGDVSRNQQTFWMADTKSGGRVFEAYWANLPDGVEAFVAGTKVKITGKLMKYVNANNGNVIAEMKNATVVILEDDGGQGGTADEGTPITCAEAVQLTNALADGGSSTETYTVTGYITQVIGTVSTKTGTPQQSFWMSDTQGGANMFEAYYANVPAGVDAFAVGMKVKITGQLTKYVKDGNVTCEIKNATVVILENGGGQGGNVTPVEGTSVTCSQAVDLANALADGKSSTEVYSVTGYITEVIGNPSASRKTGEMQQSFWMSDDKGGNNMFEAYWANLPSGVSAFTVGMKITLTGQLTKYVKDGVVTPEIKNGTVVILEDGGGVDPNPNPNPEPSGDVLAELVNGGFEDWEDGYPTGWKSSSTAGNATLNADRDAHSGTFACRIETGDTANKRLATQEISLEAGTYTFSFYAKACSFTPCQTKGGYVPVNTDGSVGAYKYNSSFTDLSITDWTLVTNEFTLTEKTTVCLVIMNPKNSSYSTAQPILIDDATLTKAAATSN